MDPDRKLHRKRGKGERQSIPMDQGLSNKNRRGECKSVFGLALGLLQENKEDAEIGENPDQK